MARVKTLTCKAIILTFRVNLFIDACKLHEEGSLSFNQSISPSKRESECNKQSLLLLLLHARSSRKPLSSCSSSRSA
ncbi:hypothetical protein RIF29_37654 [Crotalaria pallida]|uniref:Uncharacterized protein n=1 Tax=Crotalaria pallida TaxID=3830 RepID=A0AAN9ECX1_CROPI